MLIIAAVIGLILIFAGGQIKTWPTFTNIFSKGNKRNIKHCRRLQAVKTYKSIGTAGRFSN